jgi:3-hydroxyisobutyrate dehydrogenase
MTALRASQITSVAPVGILGLGRIGAGVARALARHGHRSCGFDVRAAAGAAVGAPIRLLESPAAVAQECDTLLVAVMDDAQVRDVLCGPAGILGGASPAQTIVVLSTVSLATLRWADERAGERGVGLLDCGVTGGSGSLDADGMVGMVGGPPELIALVRPTLETFLAPVIEVGPLGNGMRAKLARNLIGYAGWLVAWEGARLALASGVPLERFVEVVRQGDRLNPDHLAQIARGIGLGLDSAADSAAARTTAGYVHKDLAAALDLADELDVEAPTARLTLELCDAMFGLVEEQ